MRNKENQKYFKAGLTCVVVIALGLLMFFFLFRFSSVRRVWASLVKSMRPFIYGGVIAYLLAPFCGRMERFFGKLSKKNNAKWVKIVSILLSLLLMAAVVWLLFRLILPQVWESLQSLATNFPKKSQELEDWLLKFIRGRPEAHSAMEGFYDRIIARIQGWLDAEIMPMIESWASSVESHIIKWLAVAKDLIIGLMISTYYLASRRQLGAQARLIFHSIVPCDMAEHIRMEFRFADKMFNGFLRGKLLDSLIIGIICLIGTYLMGISSAMLVSLIVGVTNIIPVFGPFIGAVPCAVLILLESPVKCLYFIIFIIILQQIDGNFIGPLILGDTIGISGFWIMFSILLFGGMWGILGMIIGVPMFAVIYDFIRQLVFRRLENTGDVAVVDDYVDRFHPNTPEEEIPIFIRPMRLRRRQQRAAGEDGGSSPQHGHDHDHREEETEN